MKRFLSILIILSMLFTCLFLSSCGGNKRKERSSFSLDIGTAVTSLDPLLAQNNNDYIIARNAFEGLMYLDSDNNLKNGVCDDFTVSEDSKTYTFKLKDKLKWNDGTKLTSDDFRFMAERVLDKTVDSPYAMYFKCIKGASDYHAGKADAKSLGIETPDEKTIVFKLNRADKSFLYTLAKPFAMPCNRNFFEGCKGKYGLFSDKTLYNGCYSVSNFDNKSITLKANSEYYDQSVISANYVSITQNVKTVNSYNNFYEKSTNVLRFNGEDYSEVSKYDNSFSTVRLYDKTYALAFNMNNEIGKNDDFRSMLCNTFDSSVALKGLSEYYETASGFIPPFTFSDGKSYRDTAEKVSVVPDYAKAKAAEKAFKESFADGEQIPELSVIYPDNLNIKDIMANLVTPWQVQFGIYVNPTPLSVDEYNSRISSGDYQMAIIAYSSSDLLPLSFLQDFASSTSNKSGYSSNKFDELLNKATEIDINNSVPLLVECEKQLIVNDYALIPLFYSSTGFALDKQAAQSVTLLKSGGNILFKFN